MAMVEFKGLNRERSAGLSQETLRDNPDITIVTWDGPDDPEDPFNWPLRKKWWAIGVGFLINFVCTMNGTLITVAHKEINEAFHVSDAKFPNSFWPTTAWGVGGAFFPLVLLPLLEDFGVRPTVLAGYFIFICLLIPIGLAQNFATLIVVRFFDGGFVQLVSNAVVGTISNVFENDRQRSIPINLYVTVYLVSTSFGPVIGAAILQYLSWRWIGYIELIWTAALFPFLFLGIPESRASAILKKRARKLRREGVKAYAAEELDRIPYLQILKKSVKRPLYMLFTEPVAFVAAVWTSFSLGIIYLFTQSVEQVYHELYHWDAVQAGYVQVSIVIGEMLGCGLAIYSDRWYFQSAARNTEVPGTPIPEARLYASIIGGSFGVTGGMLVYGWTAYPNIPWIAPTIGLVMVGFGTTAVVVSICNYMIDAYAKYAASALAALGFLENNTLAFLPLAASAMYTNLGFHWASTLLGVLSLILVAAPLAVLKWGREIRSRSPFMAEAIIDRCRERDTHIDV